MKRAPAHPPEEAVLLLFFLLWLLFPLAFYCLVLGTINRRTQPLLVSGSWDKTVRIWEVGTGRMLQTLSGYDHAVYSVALDPRGRWLASGSEDGTIKLWRLGDTAK